MGKISRETMRTPGFVNLQNILTSQASVKMLFPSSGKLI